MSRLASTAEPESQKDEASETHRSMMEARVSTLEVELNSKFSIIEGLEKSNSNLQEEVVRLKTIWEVTEKKSSNLEEKNIGLNTTQDEAVAQQLSTQEELNYYNSDNFKKHIIDDFKWGEDFGKEVRKEAVTFLDKGCVHIICQLYHYFKDKFVLLQALEVNLTTKPIKKGWTISRILRKSWMLSKIMIPRQDYLSGLVP